MFRTTNAHLQEDTLYTCSIWYCHSANRWVFEYYWNTIYLLLRYNL